MFKTISKASLYFTRNTQHKNKWPYTCSAAHRMPYTPPKKYRSRSLCSKRPTYDAKAIETPKSLTEFSDTASENHEVDHDIFAKDKSRKDSGCTVDDYREVSAALWGSEHVSGK